MKNLNTKLVFSVLAILFAMIFFGHMAFAQQTQSAKFRVTLNGFAVNNQSDDDIFEGDGKGDEVYFRADVWKMDKNGGVSVKQTLKSAVLGDTNNKARGQAGSASNKGGLRTNDKYPTVQPWMRGAGLSKDQPPMLLWEGTLIQGEDGVSIVPTVWEWDSPSASASENEWDKILDTLFASLKPYLLYKIQSKVKTQFSMAQALSDHPIMFGGQTSNPAVNLRDKSGTRPIGLSILPGRTVAFLPAILSLNYDSALEAFGETLNEIYRNRFTHDTSYGVLFENG